MGLTVGIALVLLMANTSEGLSIMYLFTVEMLLFMFFRNCLLIEKND